MGIVATMPQGRFANLPRIGPDLIAAPMALAVGFCLVGVALLVAVPLVALASFVWTMLNPRALLDGRSDGRCIPPFAATLP